jgi:hypothetical protein
MKNTHLIKMQTKIKNIHHRITQKNIHRYKEKVESILIKMIKIIKNDNNAFIN